VSCYTRHLGELFPAGSRPEARRRLDAAVRSVVSLPDADCPEVWSAVKRELQAGPEFGERVRGHLAAGSSV
jgi:hypothetical protein